MGCQSVAFEARQERRGVPIRQPVGEVLLLNPVAVAFGSVCMCTRCGNHKVRRSVWPGRVQLWLGRPSLFEVSIAFSSQSVQNIAGSDGCSFPQLDQRITLEGSLLCKSSPCGLMRVVNAELGIEN